MAETYPTITPFLKGIHLTLDSWRANRDSEGWKVKRPGVLDGYWCSNEERWISTSDVDGEAPKEVDAAPRLRADVETLAVLTEADHPPLRYIRSKSISVALYGFGDASGTGFGGTIETDRGILYRHGVWEKDD